MSRFINPFTDFGFKRLFGQKDHKRILLGFLNALFEGEFVIKDLTYHDKEQLGLTREHRCVIYDIYCTLADGSHVIVEMQNKRESNFDARALYYASNAIVSQGQKGSAWRFEYAPVIGVYFLNFRQEELGKAFRSDFSITKTIETFAHTHKQQAIVLPSPPKTSEPIAREAPQADVSEKTQPQGTTKSPFADKLRMVFLQLPEFTLEEDECRTDLEKWTFIMIHMEQLQSIPWAAQDELYAELSKVSNLAALTPKERAIYDETLRQYRDNLACLDAAFADGEKNKAIAVARGMLSDGLPVEVISKYTGLTQQEIEALK